MAFTVLVLLCGMPHRPCGCCYALMRETSDERLDPGLLKLATILLVRVLAPLFDNTIVNMAVDILDSNVHASLDSRHRVSL